MKNILLKTITFLLAVSLLFSGSAALEAQPETAGYTSYLPPADKINTPSGVSITLTSLELLSDSAQTISASESNEYGSNVCRLTENQSVAAHVNVPDEGFYHLSMDYFDLTGGMDTLDMSLSVNGKIPYEELSRFPLPSLWKSQEASFETDRFDNELSPSQEKLSMWQSVSPRDFRSIYSEPLLIPLKSGENTLTLTLNLGEILLGNVRIFSQEVPVAYDEYIKRHEPSKVSDLIIEAECPYSKSSTAILPFSDRDVDTEPYDTKRDLINAISGDSFSQSGMSLNYRFDVKKAGLYKITVKYKQSEIPNSSVFRTFELDGKLPFAECKQVAFEYTDSYKNQTLGRGETDFLFYLEEGEHTLTISADSGLYSGTLVSLNGLIKDIGDLYLSLKKLVGNKNDGNRDWVIDDYYPNIKDDLLKYAELIDGLRDGIMAINGSKKNNTALSCLQTASRQLEALARKPDKIPEQIEKLTEGGGSVISSLSQALVQLSYQPLTIDRFYITDPNSVIPKPGKGFAAALWDMAKRFFYSFFDSSYRMDNEEKALTVWVNRPRSLMDRMQAQTDAEFTKNTGIKVNYSMMPDESKITLSAMAGSTPDIAMGISNWLPYDLGIRTIPLNLAEFDDFGQTVSRFSPGAMLPLIEDGKAFALPETQNFNVLFYRKDILANLGIAAPDTWEDVAGLLPELQQRGMNMYIPISGADGNKGIATTAPFIYQHGGSLYSEDGTKCALDSEESVKGIKTLTNLYTLYGMPLQVPNFFEHFRDGTLPIGVAGFDVYIMLKIAAPELNGLWDIALSPGVMNKDGVIQRWQSGSGTSCMVFGSTSYPEESWELLKWWLDTDTQTRFARDLQALYGNEFLWNSANINAFENSPIDRRHRKIILEQWEWLMEFPRVPGWYMVERELSNAWNSIVFDSKNPRAQIDIAVDTSNKELTRKLTEFGYIKNGQVVKPYHVTTIQDVESMAK